MSVIQFHSVFLVLYNRTCLVEFVNHAGLRSWRAKNVRFAHLGQQATSFFRCLFDPFSHVSFQAVLRSTDLSLRVFQSGRTAGLLGTRLVDINT